jgi:hypothetical protein
VQTLEQRKLEVLKRIQEKFLTENDDGSQDMESSIFQLQNNLGNSSTSKFTHSFGVGGGPTHSKFEAKFKNESSRSE